MAFNQVAVLGPGLLGGSIGLALRKRGLGEVRFWGRSEERLTLVREAGFFGSRNLGEVLEGADLVVLATPVPFFAELAQQLVALRGSYLVTDVGSVKGAVEAGAGEILRASGIPFIGSHPMAGSEQGGFEAASEDLFEGATCFVCPTETEERASVANLAQFWRSLGCGLQEMAPDEHDQVVARISHLPHALAAVAARVSLRHQGEGRLGGGGLIDTTRVAAGNAEMWTGILMENQTAVLEELERAAAEVTTLRELLLKEDAEGLQSWLADAKRRRDQLK